MTAHRPVGEARPAWKPPEVRFSVAVVLDVSALAEALTPEQIQAVFTGIGNVIAATHTAEVKE